ncbi:hypothetical protein SETIT_7G184900v2 [Setaria italica]|uniref:Uncharacterized protein n=2 Tax=Setaria TaxID=4554 RepID=A0A368RYW4_SETIT|nr:hypothetical protein SETIT_7G184900v2 [Setaria italica]TKW05715.1 hypothetical protein SEVIR_7G195000v2 [Setaria viridis]
MARLTVDGVARTMGCVSWFSLGRTRSPGGAGTRRPFLIPFRHHKLRMSWAMAAFERCRFAVRQTDRPDAKLNKKDRQQYARVRCRVSSMSIGQDTHFQWLYRAAQDH